MTQRYPERERAPMFSQPWLIRKAGAARRLRLYCFCYAGGNAISYLPWQEQLGPDIEVCAIQLPGRGTRMREAPYHAMPPLIAEIMQVVLHENKLPFAFFGHSLGGLMAYELTRQLAKNRLPLPQHLFVSGTDAPQYRSPSKNLHLLPDDELIQSLRNYNGTPAEILDNRDLMDFLLPTIRADFALAETYQYQAGPPLTVPITVLAGQYDDHVSMQEVQGWREETVGECDIRWFNGDHFFINSEQRAVLDCILGKLRPQFCHQSDHAAIGERKPDIVFANGGS